MDPAIKHWLGLWDHLDHNFWSFWQWAATELQPEEAGWQPAVLLVNGVATPGELFFAIAALDKAHNCPRILRNLVRDKLAR